MGENRDAARLGRIWDALGRGQDVTGKDADLENVSEIRRLLRLDRQPAPDTMFVARLERDLIRPSPAIGDSPRTEPPTPFPLRGATALDGSGRIPWGDEVPAWRRWVVAAAILVLAGVLAATAVFSGGGDSTKPTVLPAYGAASPDAPPWQETASCDVPPRPAEDFTALLAGTPPATLPATGSLEVVAPRDPADAIEETVRELTACRNARDVARHYALWTDEAILRADLRSGQDTDQSLLETLIRSMDYVVQLNGTPEPVLESGVWRLLGIDDVSPLPEGRVRATVRFLVPGGELAMEMIFVGRDGVALLDDAEGWTYESSDDGTPSA